MVEGVSLFTQNRIRMVDIEFDIDDIDESDIKGYRQMVPMILPDDDYIDYEHGIDSLPDELPIIPLRDALLFPKVTIPIMVGREKSRKLISYLEKQENKHVLVVTQKNPDEEDPGMDDLMPEGVIAEVMRVMQVNDKVLTVIIQGKMRADLTGITTSVPFLTGRYVPVMETYPKSGDMEFMALAESLRETMANILMIKRDAPPPFIASVNKLRNPEIIINFCSANFIERMEQKFTLLLTSDLKQRGYMAHKYLNDVFKLLELKQEIQQKTRVEMDKQQKDYFLQQQMRMIREELEDGTPDDDTTTLLNRGTKKDWPEGVHETFKKEVKKLSHMSNQSPDYSVQLQYVQTLLDLPWNEVTTDNFNISNAAKTLDKDHFGLEKVKERILEHLAVLKLQGNLRAPIICLYGPPGVGKTSLGKSIADALKRKYVRISLGGLHDEAEIRGHRRTYIGAMPGRVIKGFLRAGSSNPVFVLDEIDKLASDYKGDPSSALLEVLDPEQNNTFHDNYLDLDYDLSKALFIATANSISDIPGPLRDRMEMIPVSGYIMEEKVQIASKHLLPKALKLMGLKRRDVKISDATMVKIIENYTGESGVRELDKKINEILRKLAKKSAYFVEEHPEESFFPVTVKADQLLELLGSAKYSHDQYEGNKYAGVVTGLAWTSIGGEILTVESAVSPSKAGKMSITGNLGDVMKESAVLALEYLKSHAVTYDLNPDLFDYWNVHIHVPEGAIPKDGPSAGITLVTSLLSTFTQRKVNPNVAMTGEITLRGKVLPVGGIKEKILAAKRSGIKTIILCKENRKDVEEIKGQYVAGLQFVYVSDIKEVIDHALSKEVVENPIDLVKRIEDLKKVTAGNKK